MKIFDNPGAPNPARIRIVLAEKGLDSQIEFVKVDLISAEHKSLRIRRGNDETLSADEIVSRMIIRPVNPKAILAGLRRTGLLESAPGGLFRIAIHGCERLAALDAPLLDLHRQQLAQLSALEMEELNRLLVKARQRPAN